MSTVKTVYGTTHQTITVTLASLASGSSRESTLIDNTTNVYLDALVQAKIKTGASALSGDKAVYVYVWGTADTSTPTYPDTVTGTDAAITPNSPTQLKLLGTIWVAATATTYISEPMSVAAQFGGNLPAKWGLVFTNSAGAALDATGGNFDVFYQGIQAQIV